MARRKSELEHPPGQASGVGSSDAIKAGDVVAVIGLRLHGGPYLEGWASVADARCIAPNHFRVRFRGEKILRSRFVNPGWQRDPRRSLALLRAFWDASHDAAIEEFFPSEAAE
jgi:hypothetical protein